MTEAEGKSLEELQKLKLQSEIDKNTAEAAESRKRTKFRWANYIIAGVIGAAAIYSWVHSTFSDLAKERNELANIRRERLQIRSDSLLAVSAELANQKTALSNQVKAITARLDSTVSHQQKELRLVTARLREKEKTENQFNRIEINRLTAQISKLNEDIKNTKNEKEQIKSITPVYLSVDDATRMLKDKNYYDSRLNPDAPGANNKYKLQQNGKVVYDDATGLTWQQSGSLEPVRFKNLQAYIRQINQKKYAGYSDWRLPTLEQAMSLMEPTRLNGDSHIDSKFDKKQGFIWTSDKSSASSAWSVSFYRGYCYHNLIRYYGGLDVRVVR